jgi:ribonucleoside-diphosphate reductase beta chain
LNLYKHVNAPEARLYLSRQLYEEALHVQFYLTLLDSYIPHPDDRAQAFTAIENIPSIKSKAQFCFKWMDSINTLTELKTIEDRRKFLMNMICFATCIEGMFFFAAFAYVYFLRSKGLLTGLASGTNWVFRDESMHIAFASEVIRIARAEEPELFNEQMEEMVTQMLEDAIDCEMEFAKDILDSGIAGLSLKDMRQYLEFVADQRLESLNIKPRYNTRNPFSFMELQDMQELANFFERRVSAYQTGVTGQVAFDETF